MKLTYRHKGFCADILAGKNQTESYLNNFQTTNRRSAATSAGVLLNKPDIIQYLDELKKINKSIADAAHSKAVEEMKDKILSATELDYFQTQVIKDEVLVEEIYPIREYVPIRRNEAGEILEGTGRWIISFKKVTRKPNVREKLVAADMLHRRQGNYSPTRFKGLDNDPDPSDNKPRRDMIILSNGEKIPMNDND